MQLTRVSLLVEGEGGLERPHTKGMLKTRLWKAKLESSQNEVFPLNHFIILLALAGSEWLQLAEQETEVQVIFNATAARVQSGCQNMC